VLHDRGGFGEAALGEGGEEGSSCFLAVLVT